MELMIGVMLGLMTIACSRLSGFDRERCFFPVLFTVIATYYVLFAVLGNSQEALVEETLAVVLFGGLAIAAYKRTLWLVVGGLLGHGLFDLVHGTVIVNPGVPPFWPVFCLGFDVVAAAYLSVLMVRRELQAQVAGC
jgi:hypothetical protein